MSSDTNTGDEKPNFTGIKVNEILADFFTKKMEKLKKTHSKEKKYKKHKKEKKSKHKKKYEKQRDDNAKECEMMMKDEREKSMNERGKLKSKKKRKRSRSNERRTRMLQCSSPKSKKMENRIRSTEKDYDYSSKEEVWVPKDCKGTIPVSVSQEKWENQKITIDIKPEGPVYHNTQVSENQKTNLSDSLGKDALPVFESTIRNDKIGPLNENISIIPKSEAVNKIATTSYKNLIKQLKKEVALDDKPQVFEVKIKTIASIDNNTELTNLPELKILPQVEPSSESESFWNPESQERKSKSGHNKLKGKLSDLKKRELFDKSADSEESLETGKHSKDRTHSKHEKKSKRRKDGNHDKSYRKRSPSRDSYHHHKSKKPSHDRRSNSREPVSKPSRDPEKIDKAKLLEIAKRNALYMLESGTLPQGVDPTVLKKEQLVSIKAGAKSVEELTDFCRTLSEKNTSDDANNVKSESEDTGMPFLHHPFKLKEPSAIKLNIRNSVPLPVKSHSEIITENARVLSNLFPVSSGNQHRKKELEWVPVEDKKTEPVPPKSVPEPPPLPPMEQPPLPPLPPEPPEPIQYPFQKMMQPPLPPMPFVDPLCIMPPVLPEKHVSKPAVEPNNVVYATLENQNIDLTGIVAKRLQALRKIKENPLDYQAHYELREGELKVQKWVESQQIPGRFTGSTDVKLLSVKELCGKPYFPKKDFLVRAAPVTEGKGMSLMKKMGWNPGEGLGKNKEGTLDPLSFNIKVDKKGIMAEEETKNKNPGSMYNIANKHPVSILMELCSKKKWDPPSYNIVQETGPSHKRSFLFKVLVNGIEYQPSVSCPNKKLAKAEAAVLCLRNLGLLPDNYTLKL